MSYRKKNAGFTIPELLVVIVISGIVLAVFTNFFTSAYISYLNLHENALRSNEVSSALQRISKVARGSHTILEAEQDSFTAYAYFTPRDSTLSKVRFYYDTNKKSLMAGVIPATGNSPDFTYNQADEQSITMVRNIEGGYNFFEYLNSQWQPDTFDAVTFKDIKGVRIKLTTTQLDGNRAPITVETAVSLRNRKSNL